MYYLSTYCAKNFIWYVSFTNGMKNRLIFILLVVLVLLISGCSEFLNDSLQSYSVNPGLYEDQVITINGECIGKFIPNNAAYFGNDINSYGLSDSEGYTVKVITKRYFEIGEYYSITGTIINSEGSYYFIEEGLE
jgi:hypothetical protein